MVIDIGWKADHKDHRLACFDQSHDAVFLSRDGYDQTGDDELAGRNHVLSALPYPGRKTMAFRLTIQTKLELGQLRLTAHDSSWSRVRSTVIRPVGNSQDDHHSHLWRDPSPRRRPDRYQEKAG